MLLAWVPFIFNAVFLTLIIVLVVKVVKALLQRGNNVVLQKIAIDSVQLQKDTLLQQGQLLDELTEINSRLIAVEKVLKDVG